MTHANNVELGASVSRRGHALVAVEGRLVDAVWECSRCGLRSKSDRDALWSSKPCEVSGSGGGA